MILLLWPFAAAALSGLLLALCYPPFSVNALVWVALVPWIAALWFSGPWKKRDFLRPLLIGFLAGAVFFLCVFSWIITVTALGWFLLALYLALYPAVWSWFVVACATPRGKDPSALWLSSTANLRVTAIAAAGWVTQEWLRGTVFSGFGWNGLGVALHEQIPLIQIASFTGVLGLSFLVAMCSFMLVATVRRFIAEVGSRRIRPHLDFSVTLALVALSFAYGIREMSRKIETEPLRVAAVQTNIPQEVRWADGTEEQILESLLLQTEQAVALRPDVILWPESATPQPLLSDNDTFQKVSRVAQTFDGDLLTGTVHFAVDAAYNSVALLSDKATAVQLQHKQHLVPFGEFVPFRESFPLFAWIVADQIPGDFDAGREATPLQLTRKDIRLGALICFEDTLGYITRRFALNGVQLFVNVTNDGWFGKSAGSEQHLANAVFRGPETGLPMVRCANTGVTCFIDRLGSVRQTLSTEKGDTFITGILLGGIDVPRNPERTLYTRNGDLFAYACVAVTAWCVLAAFWRTRRAGAPTSNPNAEIGIHHKGHEAHEDAED